MTPIHNGKPTEAKIVVSTEAKRGTDQIEQPADSIYEAGNPVAPPNPRLMDSMLRAMYCWVLSRH